MIELGSIELNENALLALEVVPRLVPLIWMLTPGRVPPPFFSYFTFQNSVLGKETCREQKGK